jgi:beta-D-xylosidase 4
LNLYEIGNPNPDPPPQFAKRSPVCQTDPFCAKKACDKSLSQDARIEAFLQEMTVAEKAENLVNGAAGVPRLGLPPYEWWSEVKSP